MDDTAIRCFLIAAEQMSFTGAAEELFISRQAVSRQIRKLEKEIGTPLFQRGPGELRLTSSGEMCREFFLETQNRWQRLQRQLKQPEVPHILISCVGGIDVWRLLNKSMQKVQKTWSFEVDIVYHRQESLAEELRTGNQDLYITFRPGDESMIPSRFVWESISPVNMCLAVGINHPRCAGATSAADFAGEPVVSWLRKNETEEHCIQNCIHDCQGLGFQPGKVLLYPNMESAHAAIEFCKGVGLCSTVSKLVSSPAVRCFPLQPGADLVCLYDSSALSPVCSALLHTLLHEE